MKHHNRTRTLGRNTDQRRALLRSLARSLVIHGAISTTETRARELKKFIEPLVTRSKTGLLADRRIVASRLANDEIAKRIMVEIAPRYKERPGGYTRVVKKVATGGTSRREAVISFV